MKSFQSLAHSIKEIGGVEELSAVKERTLYLMNSKDRAMFT